MSDAPEYPYPEDGGRTHYWGCFRERGHHNCAVAEVARLGAENARLREIIRLSPCHCDDILMRGGDGKCNRCAELEGSDE